ncbi:hypothetical protein [Streptacidiphilus sp. MAP12-16]|uniref:hypothetical protein n=1 Tax=Streptacidiphilus sp. MAP12-16 TaxID=3156300 RepID=UPI0035175744
MTKSFEGTNPTWVKKASSEEERIHIPSVQLDQAIATEQEFLFKRAQSSPRTDAPIALITADSGHLPIADRTVDVVLTSPPYLTRIDYAVAYSRELAILGLDIFNDKKIRYALMGTTLTRNEFFNRETLGSVASALLGKIEAHDSKASTGYYLKQARQYLTDLTCSLDEITRVSKFNGLMHLVVQDSYYKDVPVALADICIDESQRRGWVLEERENFPVRRLLTSLNKSARAYTKGEVAETVVTLRRKS